MRKSTFCIYLWIEITAVKRVEEVVCRFVPVNARIWHQFKEGWHNWEIQMNKECFWFREGTSKVTFDLIGNNYSYQKYISGHRRRGSSPFEPPIHNSKGGWKMLSSKSISNKEKSFHLKKILYILDFKHHVIMHKKFLKNTTMSDNYGGPYGS